MKVQSVKVDLDRISLSEAKEWLSDHGYKTRGPDFSKDGRSVRFRQHDPSKFETWGYGWGDEWVDGIRPLYGCPKSRWGMSRMGNPGREYLELGPTPADEECAQVGADDYPERSRREARAYIHQLQRLFPKAEFGSKSFPHDFGSYREVVVYYDPDDSASMDVAFEVEGNLPSRWDQQALDELEGTSSLGKSFSEGWFLNWEPKDILDTVSLVAGDGYIDPSRDDPVTIIIVHATDEQYPDASILVVQGRKLNFDKILTEAHEMLDEKRREMGNDLEDDWRFVTFESSAKTAADLIYNSRHGSEFVTIEEESKPHIGSREEFDYGPPSDPDRERFGSDYGLGGPRGFRPIRLNVMQSERLIDRFEIPTWEDLDERISESSEIYGYVYDEAKKEGLSDEEAEKRASEAEEEERNEYFQKWENASLNALQGEFSDVGLEIEKKKGEFIIAPTTSWEEAADKIRDVINGYGPFWFRDLKEFLDSGPYTARDAVAKHLGWIADRAEVYGDRGAKNVYYDMMR